MDGPTVNQSIKKQVRCNEKGLQRFREFFWSETQLCSAESLHLWSQKNNFSKYQYEVLEPTCYLNTLQLIY